MIFSHPHQWEEREKNPHMDGDFGSAAVCTWPGCDAVIWDYREPEDGGLRADGSGLAPDYQCDHPMCTKEAAVYAMCVEHAPESWLREALEEDPPILDEDQREAVGERLASEYDDADADGSASTGTAHSEGVSDGGE